MARNKGIESCRGEWVVFVDSDDSIFPDLLAMIAEEKSTDLIERLLRFWPLAKGGHTDPRAPWAKAFRRSILEQYSIRFPPNLRVGEDALFNIEFILRAQSCKYIPIPAYWHRVRMGSISRSYAALRYNYKIGILPRRILLGFFQLRCYWIVKSICRVCFFFIEQIDKRQAKESL